MCLYPKMITNRKYTKNKKNGGIIPPIFDERARLVPVGCGECIECRKQEARKWQVRLQEDIKYNKNGKFITLTFSNESIKHINSQIPETYKTKQGDEIPLVGYKRDNEMATWAVRHFLERWRKKYKKSIRHWLITELGHNGTENIHLHGILWTDKIEDVKNIWGYGYVWDGETKNGRKTNYVNNKTINYTIKYVHKRDEKHKYYKSKILTSAGIGKGYTENPKGEWNINKYDGENTIETYRTETGHKIAMPVYWRNKIYTETEREKLWIQKLDKQERWICGERVDISNGEEEYYNLLQWHRQRNKQLGYGTDRKDWTRQQYEEERRIILQQKRIENSKE